ncbi:MAG: Gfo/Idh/MocA family protein [Pseudobdellovibrionaceae bacterium]
MSLQAKKIRTAVVGVGYLGQFHAQKYKNTTAVDFIGVCDQNFTQAEKVAGDLKVKAFRRPEDLLGQVDAVTIAASTLSHYELAELFLKNGIHVNVEKPIAAELHQAEKLVELARKNKLKLAVGHIERFNPCLQELKKRMEVSQDLKSLHLLRRATFKLRGSDVSVLHDLMIHDIDLVYWLAGSEIESIEASGLSLVSKELDSAYACVKLKNGVVASIEVSRVASEGQRQVRAVLSSGIYSVNSGTQEIEYVSGVGGLQKASDAGENPVQIEKWTVDKADALQKETDAFIQSIVDDSLCVVTGEDGLKAMQAILLIQKQIEKQWTQLAQK